MRPGRRLRILHFAPTSGTPYAAQCTESIVQASLPWVGVADDAARPVCSLCPIPVSTCPVCQVNMCVLCRLASTCFTRVSRAAPRKNLCKASAVGTLCSLETDAAIMRTPVSPRKSAYPTPPQHPSLQPQVLLEKRNINFWP